MVVSWISSLVLSNSTTSLNGIWTTQRLRPKSSQRCIRKSWGWAVNSSMLFYLMLFIYIYESFFFFFINSVPDPSLSTPLPCVCVHIRTAIAHSIREQVQTYQKSLFLIGHPSDGSMVQDEELKLSFLPSLTSGARPVAEVQMFTPLLNYLSDGELERTEKERDKDLNKRRKRNTRGRRGIALPDREPIRTYRTPAIGFPELDAATLALAAAASAPMSRRAAAAAASVTIANMVASENGTAFMPQMMPSASAPQPPPTTASKEKKPKGLFKPPSYPASVLRPRAQVVAPTPSTALETSSSHAEVSAENEAPPSSSSTTIAAATAATAATATPAPVSSFGYDNKNSKMMTARRAKELEREAKEKEFVDGQHPNFIDGVWHCSNCGCPDSIAIGRRKGPLGDKSQCGTCGTFSLYDLLFCVV